MNALYFNYFLLVEILKATLVLNETIIMPIGLQRRNSRAYKCLLTSASDSVGERKRFLTSLLFPYMIYGYIGMVFLNFIILYYF